LVKGSVETELFAPPTYLFLKGKSGRDFVKGTSIDYFYLRGEVGEYSFRIKLRCLTNPGTFKSLEFRYFRKDKFPWRYYFYLGDKKNGKNTEDNILTFLRGRIPDSLDATLLVMVMIRKAVERSYFAYIDECVLFEPGKARYDGDVFSDERFESIKKWLMIYFTLEFGFFLTVLEMLLECVGAHFVRTKEVE
jgi:hypothetical protein